MEIKLIHRAICLLAFFLALIGAAQSSFEHDIFKNTGPCAFTSKDGRTAYGCDEDDIFGRRRNIPPRLFSIGGNGIDTPIRYKPESQSFVVSRIHDRKLPSEYWEEEQRVDPDNKNCLLCEERDSGACNSMPSCVYCESTVTASCERGVPCLRCTVIKNPFFRCKPGEKYMDECDSCRCLDGHSGWCTNMYCEFRSLYLFAMKLSDGDYY